MSEERSYKVVSGTYGRREDVGGVKVYKKGDVVSLTLDVAQRLGRQVVPFEQSAEEPVADAVTANQPEGQVQQPMPENDTPAVTSAFVMPTADVLHAMPVAEAARLLASAPDVETLQKLADMECQNPKNPGGRNGVKKAFERRASELK